MMMRRDGASITRITSRLGIPSDREEAAEKPVTQ